MTRRVLVFGLVLLAVFLPLAAVRTEIFVLEEPVFVADTVSFVNPARQPVALLALASFRAPPSR